MPVFTFRCCVLSLGLFLAIASPLYADPPAARTDIHGDPLPPGARARLGTLRLWHGSAVTRLTFAPDSKTFFTGVRQWDAETGREIRSLSKAEPFKAFAYSADCKLLATAAEDKVIRLWDVAKGELLKKWSREEKCAALAFSPDGKTLALLLDGEKKDFVCLWDIVREKEVRCLEVAVPGREDEKSMHDAPPLAFSADDKHLVAEYGDRLVLWDLATGKTLRRYEVPGKKSGIACAAFAPDGRSLAAIDFDGNVLRWEVASLDPLPALRELGKGDYTGLAFANDGKSLAAVSGSGSIHVWQLDSGELLHELTCEGENLQAAAFSPDGKTLVCGSEQGALHIWDLGKGQERVALGPRPEFEALAFTRGGSALVSTNGRELRRWDVVAAKETGRWQLNKDDSRVPLMSLSADGQVLAVAEGKGTTITLYDTLTGKLLREVEIPAGKNGVPLVAPDGRRVALVGHDDPASLILYDVNTGKEVRRLKSDHDVMKAAVFTPDGRTLITGGDRLIVLELSTGKPRLEIPGLAATGAPRADQDLTVSPDSRMLAVIRGETVALVRLGTGRVMGRCEGHAREVTAQAFSPDGKLLVTGDQNGDIRLWEAATGKALGSLTGHQDRITQVVFSRDGKMLATGSDDHTALIWDVVEAMRVARQRQKEAADARPLEEAMWSDLASEDGVPAGAVIQTLLTSPEQAVVFLKVRLKPAAPLDPKLLARLITDLESSEFEARDKATKELAKLGDRAEVALRKALEGEPSPELRKRVEGLLEQIEQSSKTPDQLRAARAVEMLEQIGTPAARAVLEELARGAADDYQTREAKTALKRLTKGTTP
jgi:WD40 repeat protein